MFNAREVLAHSRGYLQKLVGYDRGPWSSRTWTTTSEKGKTIRHDLHDRQQTKLGPPRQLITGRATGPATSVVTWRVRVPTADSGAVIYDPAIISPRS